MVKCTSQPGVLVCIMCRLQYSCMVCLWPIRLMYSCMYYGLLANWCTVTIFRSIKRLVHNWMYVYSSASRLVYSYFSYAIQEILHSHVYSSSIWLMYVYNLESWWQGLKRILCKPVQKRKPVTTEILADMIQDTNKQPTLSNLRITTFSLLAFAGFLRFD